MPLAHQVNEGHTRHRQWRVSCAILAEILTDVRPENVATTFGRWSRPSKLEHSGNDQMPSRQDSLTSWRSGRGYHSGKAAPPLGAPTTV